MITGWEEADPLSRPANRLSGLIFFIHKQLGIDARTVEVGAPVEVGPGGDAGAADGAYGIAFVYHIPLLDAD